MIKWLISTFLLTITSYSNAIIKEPFITIENKGEENKFVSTVNGFFQDGVFYTYNFYNGKLALFDVHGKKIIELIEVNSVKYYSHRKHIYFIDGDELYKINSYGEVKPVLPGIKLYWKDIQSSVNSDYIANNSSMIYNPSSNNPYLIEFSGYDFGIVSDKGAYYTASAYAKSGRHIGNTDDLFVIDNKDGKELFHKEVQAFTPYLKEPFVLFSTDKGVELFNYRSGLVSDVEDVTGEYKYSVIDRGNYYYFTDYEAKIIDIKSGEIVIKNTCRFENEFINIPDYIDFSNERCFYIVSGKDFRVFVYEWLDLGCKKVAELDKDGFYIMHPNKPIVAYHDGGNKISFVKLD